MSERLPPCPQPPDWRIDWDGSDRRATLAWLRAPGHFRPQDPVFHAEGDVLTHTKMVCEELRRPCRRGVPSTTAIAAYCSRQRSCTTRRNPPAPAPSRTAASPRAATPGRGAVLARRVLWQLGVPFAEREQVAALVRYHQVPYFLADQSDAATPGVITVAQTSRCDHLALLAEADARGRTCADSTAAAR